MQTVDNYESKIWLGLRAGYGHMYSNIADVSKVISEWCKEKKQCVTVSNTDFIYVDGWEPGLIIGFINYPRYPNSKAELKNRTLELAELLMKKFNQYRVSCTFYPTVPGGTVMLENKEMSDD